MESKGLNQSCLTCWQPCYAIECFPQNAMGYGSPVYVTDEGEAALAIAIRDPRALRHPNTLTSAPKTPLWTLRALWSMVWKTTILWITPGLFLALRGLPGNTARDKMTSPKLPTHREKAVDVTQWKNPDGSELCHLTIVSISFLRHKIGKITSTS